MSLLSDQSNWVQVENRFSDPPHTQGLYLANSFNSYSYVEVLVNYYSPKIGSLYQYLSLFNKEIIVNVFPLFQNQPLLIHPLLNNSTYKLKFIPFDSLPSFTLKVKEFMPLSPVDPNNTNQATEILINSFVVTNVASQIQSADPSIKGLIVENNSNSFVYIHDENTVSSSINLVAIPKNSIYEFAVAYGGNLWAVSTGTSSNIKVKVLT